MGESQKKLSNSPKWLQLCQPHLKTKDVKGGESQLWEMTRKKYTIKQGDQASQEINPEYSLEGLMPKRQVLTRVIVMQT